MSWVEQDALSVWHPYTQHGSAPEPLAVRSASGSTLTLYDGRTLVDAISSWWVNLHGHCHPKIVQAIHEQASSLDHVLFAGFTHEPAVRLAQTLTSALSERSNGEQFKAFYSDNGSTAVEAALKIAYQYHLNRGEPRNRFLALTGGYHGDTFGSMSVGDRASLHVPFSDLLFQVDFVDPGDLTGLDRYFDEHGRKCAAFIFEPRIQGAAGMEVYSSAFLRQAITRAREAGALSIADEVFTAFYRTGTLFGFEPAGVAPDLVCLSKGITGGLLPLAVTLCRAGVFEAFVSSDLRRAFLHGHSYTANPIACAAALASWELLQGDDCQRQIRALTAITRERTSALKSKAQVARGRCLGTIGAVELRGQTGYFSDVTSRLSFEAASRGVLLRPLGNVIYACPPYCTTPQEMHRIYDVIEELVHL